MTKRLGQIVAEGLKEFADDLEKGGKISTRYNMRKVVIDLKPQVYGPDEVRKVREILEASQAVLAVLLGVSVKAVQKWEQGEQAPCAMACRFMDEISSDPDHFKRRLEESIRIKGETTAA